MNQLQLRIKDLLPAYFALVMATGIISIAAFLSGWEHLGYGLFYLNITFLGLLLLAFSYRCIKFGDRVLEDFRSYQKGPGFFTIVAALCVVGNQLVVFFRAMDWAILVLIIASLAWLGIMYGFFFNITTTQNKKSLSEGINGTWLVIIVAIQALSVLISFISVDFGRNAYLFLFLALCLFLLGCIFYLYIMSLIIYRISFFTLHANELGAPYWINMGATAITTLSGSMLILHTEDYNFIVELLPFLKGFTLFFWAAGTWWIPLLVILGAWRHIIKKFPVPTSPEGYDPSYWGMVFPLGMYTVCTFRLSEALKIDFLKMIPEVFFYVAVFTWLAVMIGFVRQLLLIFFRRRI